MNFFALLRLLDDDSTADADDQDLAKAELTEKLQEISNYPDDESYSITQIEQKMVIKFLESSITKKRKEGGSAGAIKVLESILNRVSSTDSRKLFIEKEPREIRMLIKKISSTEQDLEKVSETVEKWRNNKHKFKSAAESQEWVSRERELTKDVGKMKEKLDKMRRDRSSYGAIDSESDEARAKAGKTIDWNDEERAKAAASWSKVINPNQQVVVNPATSLGKKNNKSNKHKATVSSSMAKGGTSKWTESDLSLAQQLQMKMVAQLKTVDNKESSEDKENNQLSDNGNANENKGSSESNNEEDGPDGEVDANSSELMNHTQSLNNDDFVGFSVVTKKKDKKKGPLSINKQQELNRKQKNNKGDGDDDSDNDENGLKDQTPSTSAGTPAKPAATNTKKKPAEPHAPPSGQLGSGGKNKNKNTGSSSSTGGGPNISNITQVSHQQLPLLRLLGNFVKQEAKNSILFSSNQSFGYYQKRLGYNFLGLSTGGGSQITSLKAWEGFFATKLLAFKTAYESPLDLGGSSNGNNGSSKSKIKTGTIYKKEEDWIKFNTPLYPRIEKNFKLYSAYLMNLGTILLAMWSAGGGSRSIWSLMLMLTHFAVIQTVFVHLAGGSSSGNSKDSKSMTSSTEESTESTKDPDSNDSDSNISIPGLDAIKSLPTGTKILITKALHAGVWLRVLYQFFWSTSWFGMGILAAGFFGILGMWKTNDKEKDNTE